MTSSILIAQTWNVDLAYEASEAMAKEFRDFGVVGWYARSMNLHRFAFVGRNFEYYSEDGFLSAAMGVAEVGASVDNGMYPYIKHFALNEQETNRNGILNTWVLEQSMRENYLKPFEECVKYAPSGKIVIMSSYNYIGNQWSGACYALQTEVFRGEWGFFARPISNSASDAPPTREDGKSFSKNSFPGRLPNGARRTFWAWPIRRNCPRGRKRS